jgi:hypothetical protein
VELDPVVTELSRRWLGLGDNPRLHVITNDARPYLALTDRRYDLMVVDVYRQPYIPFYLATREFFRLVRDHLRPGGIVALNVARVPGDDRLGDAISSTLAAEFPRVWRWPLLRFNEMVLASDRPLTLGRLAPALRPLRSLFLRELAPAGETERPLTDDRAPVESLTDRMLVEYIAHGGELEDDWLPTKP